MPPRAVMLGRVAVVHDWFQGFHGSERVVETMRAALTEAGSPPDILTFHAARELLPPALAGAIVGESRLASLPGLRQRGHDPGRWRYLLPYMPSYFARLHLEPYDVVVSSSHACAVHVRPPGRALHVCYCYTPIRYAWLPGTDERGSSRPKRLALRAASAWLRRVDRAASARPDSYVAISTAVRDRIRRFYGRDAEVIHPPVDVRRFDPTAAKEPGRFLWVQRFVPYKRPDVVAQAFAGLPYRLTMVGVGPLAAAVRAGAPPNVEVREWLPRDELAELYAGASGFVHVGEEDFGISMVEALAAGTPVVGLARGGALDIVRPDVDGVLVDRATVPAVREAVRAVAERSWDPLALAARAGAFSRERFVERFLAHLERERAARADNEPSVSASAGRARPT